MQYDKEALWRVKIGHFLKRGIPIRGVIHVGANDGYEIEWYIKLGIQHLLAMLQLEYLQGILAMRPYNKSIDTPLNETCHKSAYQLR